MIIAKVDADGVGKPLGKEFGVTGFPSMFSYLFVTSRCSMMFSSALKWFGPEGGEPEKYEGGRDLESLANLYVL